MVEVLCAPGDRAVVIPDGELWLATTSALTECVEHLIASGVREVTVDLGSVTLLCSGGVEALLHCRTVLDGADGSLHIRNASGIVERVIELTALRELATAG